MRLERVSSEPNDKITIEDLKLYANIDATDLDPMLTSLLNAAINKVEGAANVSLLERTFRLYSDKVNIELYYPPISEITSVTDASGNDITYVANNDNTKIVQNSGVEVCVEYTTTPDLQKVLELKAFVLEYAAALYDGQDDKLNKILARIC